MQHANKYQDVLLHPVACCTRQARTLFWFLWPTILSELQVYEREGQRSKMQCSDNIVKWIVRATVQHCEGSCLKAKLKACILVYFNKWTHWNGLRVPQVNYDVVLQFREWQVGHTRSEDPTVEFSFPLQRPVLHGHFRDNTKNVL